MDKEQQENIRENASSYLYGELYDKIPTMGDNEIEKFAEDMSYVVIKFIKREIDING